MKPTPNESEAELLATAIAAPWGPVHLAAGPAGVVAIELATTAEAFEAGLRRRRRTGVRWLDPEAPPTDEPAAGHLRAAIAAVAAGVAGETVAPDLADALRLDLEDRPAWDRAVLAAVRAIPRGEVRSYGEIARAVDRPGAARAVGGAVGRNPIAYAIPCHRVVAGDGTLGGYGGGWWGDRERLLDVKATLLAGEGVSLPRSRPPDRAAR